MTEPNAGIPEQSPRQEANTILASLETNVQRGQNPDNPFDFGQFWEDSRKLQRLKVDKTPALQDGEVSARYALFGANPQVQQGVFNEVRSADELATQRGHRSDVDREARAALEIAMTLRLHQVPEGSTHQQAAYIIRELIDKYKLGLRTKITEVPGKILRGLSRGKSALGSMLRDYRGSPEAYMWFERPAGNQAGTAAVASTQEAGQTLTEKGHPSITQDEYVALSKLRTALEEELASLNPRQFKNLVKRDELTARLNAISAVLTSVDELQEGLEDEEPEEAAEGEGEEGEKPEEIDTTSAPAEQEQMEEDVSAITFDQLIELGREWQEMDKAISALGPGQTRARGLLETDRNKLKDRVQEVLMLHKDEGWPERLRQELEQAAAEVATPAPAQPAAQAAALSEQPSAAEQPPNVPTPAEILDQQIRGLRTALDETGYLSPLAQQTQQTKERITEATDAIAQVIQANPDEAAQLLEPYLTGQPENVRTRLRGLLDRLVPKKEPQPTTEEMTDLLDEALENKPRPDQS